MASSDFSQKFIALLVLGLVVMGCTKEPEPVPVDSLTLSSSSITIIVGENHTLVATISPSDANNQKVLWSSADPSVVSVNDGVITALKEGFTTITAKSEDKGKTAMCMVTVIPKIYLSSEGTANCYIVSSAGAYEFTPVKGNSNEPVGDMASAEVLWETFGTDATPAVGDLVTNVKYINGAICFETPSVFRKGNAVIAAKDANGNILWSWHIWLTDKPEEQVYYNGAGTFLDRNLGATSATPGEVGTLGLFYQWGRKDPFIQSSSISKNVEAKSTIAWPSYVKSDMTNGTMEYAVANPTTFIAGNLDLLNFNQNWFFVDSDESSAYKKFWTESPEPKTIYDPCPAGWRVPVGDYNNAWDRAMGPSYTYTGVTDKSYYGMNFSGIFGAASTIWYPMAGSRYSFDGSISGVSDLGEYWTASGFAHFGFILRFDGPYLSTSSTVPKALALPVRCVHE